MRVPLSWLRDYVRLPDDLEVDDLTRRLTMIGLKLDYLHRTGHDVAGPLVVGRVLSYESETHKNGKTVRWCQVDVGEPEPRGVVCGAHNFEVDDLVVVSLPGTVLPGGFEITARKTYGHVSDGMICSDRELQLGDDHTGILVLQPGEAAPGDDAAALLWLRDDVIELEVNPDRAYALSVRGVARDAALAYELPYDDPAELEVKVGEGEAYPVRIADPDGCALFVARAVSGFDPNAPTPRWLARRIQLAGMRPISLAVDVTNYVMLELGQPIHAYDRGLLQGAIEVRRARPGERLVTLDDVDRELDPEDLLITDDRGPIGLAGVMGGATTEVSASTTSLVIEAAHFASVPIARASRRHKLISEASRRFERGVDPRLPAVAAQRVVDLLVQYGGGVVEDGQTAVGSAPEAAPIEIAATLPAEVTGISIASERTVDALRSVGCEVAESEAGRLRVIPPSWRPDLTDPYDLVEEVVRVVGYDQVDSVLPPAPAGRGLTPEQRMRRRVGYALAGAGLSEVTLFPFMGPDDLDGLGLPADDPRRRVVSIANPLSAEAPWLASTLAPGLLRAAARNVGRGQSSIAIWQVAPVYLVGESDLPPAPLPTLDRAPTAEERAALDAALPDQPRRLAIALTGDREPAGWWGDPRPATWADAIGLVRRVADVLGVTVEMRPGTCPPWHPGRCAEVVCNGAPIGHAGELHPRVCTTYGLPPRAAYAEVDLAALIAVAPTLAEPAAFSTMPVAKEDVALIVDESVPASAVEAALRRGAGELLESIRLFDLYTGEPIPEGRKSLAFALRFRAPDRTLTDAETAAARDAAVAAAREATGAEPRV
ncbi:MAG TPA: phenylalanine--tRNA ligase subunit beta [Nocardioidaceae bacterium]|nr:phenylalanine--tRNA ligase subunit beta [Nocardioidaceae bacterium]